MQALRFEGELDAHALSEIAQVLRRAVNVRRADASSSALDRGFAGAPTAPPTPAHAPPQHTHAIPTQPPPQTALEQHAQAAAQPAQVQQHPSSAALKQHTQYTQAAAHAAPSSQPHSDALQRHAQAPAQAKFSAQHTQPPALAASAYVDASAPAPPRPAGRRRWIHTATDSADHAGEGVLRVIHVPAVAGVPAADSGFLVSASKTWLNLWMREEDSGYLINVHSTNVDVHMSSVEYLAPRLLLASAQSRADKKNLLCTYAMDGSSLFRLQMKFECPKPVGALLSLQPCGGPLASSFAAASAGSVYVFDVGALHQAKANIAAHAEAVSCMQRVHGRTPMFATGANDGALHLWSLQSPPREPVLRVQAHAKRVTSIASLDENLLLTGSVDTTVRVWDLRRAGAPLAALPLDGRCVLKLAHGAGLVAVSTLKHALYTLPAAALAAPPPAGVPAPEPLLEAVPAEETRRIWPDIAIAEGRGAVYAGSMAGHIDAFHPGIAPKHY